MCVYVGGYMCVPPGSFPSSVGATGVLKTWLNHGCRTALRDDCQSVSLGKEKENVIYIYRRLWPEVISLLPYLLFMNA